MRSSAAARRYARALFSIATETSAVPSVRGELAQMAELFAGSSELQHALFRPLHPAKERRAVLRAVAERVGVGAAVRNLLQYLIDQRRIVDFDAIRAEYERLADEAAGRIKARLVTPVALGDAQRDRLRAAIAGRTGREVELEIEVDPELIGGAIAEVGGVVFDGSLRTQLSQLRDTLTRGQ